MKRFFDETDQDDSKTQGGKGQIRKIQKKEKGKEWRKEKEEIFTDVKVPYSFVLDRPGPPSCYYPPATFP
jgi:hypothetical protein